MYIYRIDSLPQCPQQWWAWGAWSGPGLAGGPSKAGRPPREPAMLAEPLQTGAIL